MRPQSHSPSPDSPASADRLRAWLTLLHAPGLGNRRLRQLLQQFGSPQAILAAGDTPLRQAGLAAATIDYLRAPATEDIDRDLEWRSQPGNRILTLAD
ncbi:MAG TPA: DNA-protecting protein DprA, partial [Gammaproteobacteria bacterium]|nr:DNA-protecting protein DprA [Gammaproteobacteria bacterium]